MTEGSEEAGESLEIDIRPSQKRTSRTVPLETGEKARGESTRANESELRASAAGRRMRRSRKNLDRRLTREELLHLAACGRLHDCTPVGFRKSIRQTEFESDKRWQLRHRIVTDALTQGYTQRRNRARLAKAENVDARARCDRRKEQVERRRRAVLTPVGHRLVGLDHVVADPCVDAFASRKRNSYIHGYVRFLRRYFRRRSALREEVLDHVVGHAIAHLDTGGLVVAPVNANEGATSRVLRLGVFQAQERTRKERTSATV